MREAVVVHVGATTALGTLDDSWAGLMAGLTGIRPHRLDGVERPLGLINGLGEGWGSANRLEALLDRLFQEMPPLAASTPLFAAATKGAADELEGEGQPADLPGMIATRLGLSGGVLVSGACASGTLAVIQGAFSIVSGRSETAVAVGLDLVSRFVTAGFGSLMALSPQPCRPFDRDRDGLSLGEGAGVLILAEAVHAKGRGWPVLARVSGWGAASDAGHITAPCAKGSGLAAAIRQAAGERPVGGINAHGTGTPKNDAMELAAFASVWGEEIPPIHGVKGAFGHTLGAAGLIEAALAARSLEAGRLPPTVGLENPVAGHEKSVANEPFPLTAPSVLSCNSGFGGVNAALLLQSP